MIFNKVEWAFLKSQSVAVDTTVTDNGALGAICGDRRQAKQSAALYKGKKAVLTKCNGNGDAAF